MAPDDADSQKGQGLTSQNNSVNSNHNTNMNQDKLTFNGLMDRHIAAVATMTQDQIDACAWLMGASGIGWTKENMAAEFQSEKHDEDPVATEPVAH
jgi:hypothetical protein